MVAEVKAFLANRVAACRAAGSPMTAWSVDPGFCFGKTLEHNIALLRAWIAWHRAGSPVPAVVQEIDAGRPHRAAGG